MSRKFRIANSQLFCLKSGDIFLFSTTFCFFFASEGNRGGSPTKICPKHKPKWLDYMFWMCCLASANWDKFTLVSGFLRSAIQSCAKMASLSTAIHVWPFLSRNAHSGPSDGWPLAVAPCWPVGSQSASFPSYLPHKLDGPVSMLSDLDTGPSR